MKYLFIIFIVLAYILFFALFKASSKDKELDSIESDKDINSKSN